MIHEMEPCYLSAGIVELVSATVAHIEFEFLNHNPLSC